MRREGSFTLRLREGTSLRISSDGRLYSLEHQGVCINTDSQWSHKKSGRVVSLTHAGMLRVGYGSVLNDRDPLQKQGLQFTKSCCPSSLVRLQTSKPLKEGTADVGLMYWETLPYFWVRPLSEFMDGRFELIHPGYTIEAQK